MQLRPADLDDSCVGSPLPWNLYSATGALVTRAGEVVVDHEQLRAMQAQPLFRHAAADASGRQAPEKSLRVLIQTLDTLFTTTDHHDLVSGIHHSVNTLMTMTRADADACLGLTRRLEFPSRALRHCVLSAQLSIGLGERQGLDETSLKSIAAAALTMNISAMPLHDELADRDKLTGEELRQIQEHPGQSVDLLYRSGVTNRIWLDAVFQHHENIDGSGYPYGLRIEDISLGARILRVADLYGAKISGRQYRPPRSSLFAMQYLFGDERRRIDRQMATQLLRRFGFFPPGTLVRLANGETAAVARIEERKNALRYPVSFLDGHKHALPEPIERDTMQPEYAITHLAEVQPDWPAIEWQRVWGYA